MSLSTNQPKQTATTPFKLVQRKPLEITAELADRLSAALGAPHDGYEQDRTKYSPPTYQAYVFANGVVLHDFQDGKRAVQGFATIKAIEKFLARREPEIAASNEARSAEIAELFKRRL